MKQGSNLMWSNLPALIKRTTNLMIDLVLPQECLGCGLSTTWLCPTCYQSLSVNDFFPCLVCRRPTWQGQTHQECRRQTAVAGLWLASFRSQLLMDLVHSFKYENLKQLAKPLAELLQAKIQHSPLGCSLMLNSKTIIMPVPLHPVKEWWRGYNQAELLARELAQTWPCQLNTEAVHRVKETISQTDLPRKKRFKNVAGAFAVSDPRVLKKKTVILVDDVITTSATISELARVIKAAGSREVYALVLARG